MANMSYCRFTNTLSDLTDCFRSWEEPLGANGGMAEQENAARYDLLQLCKRIVEDYSDDTPEDYDAEAESDDDDGNEANRRRRYA